MPIDHNPLTLGQTYSRRNLSQLFGIAGLAASMEGLFTQAASNYVLFFVTLEQEDLGQAAIFLDYFEGDLFFWESQNQQNLSSPLIMQIKHQEKTPLLLVRKKAQVNGATQEFFYAGRLVKPVADIHTAHPVRFVFKAEDIAVAEQVPPGLQALIDWRPSGGVPDISNYLAAEIAQWMTEPAEGGSGYIANPGIRREIKAHAIRRARGKYSERGYEVIDAPIAEPFDLLYRRPGSGPWRRVIVKGTPKDFDTAIVTAREVASAAAGNGNTDLVVVQRIKVNVAGAGFSYTDGGLKLKQKWRPGEADLPKGRHGYKVAWRADAVL